MNRTLSLKSPSKINLYLQVTGKRADGYHEIETIFLPLEDIYDEVKITFQESSEGRIVFSSDSANIPADSTNLCCRAAAAYLREASLKNDITIELKKNIPIAAGMGGGSSDAGAVLRLLQSNFGALSEESILKIATSVGADVPFFLNPLSSSGFGIGEILKPIDVRIPFYAVICAPSFPVSAAWAYKNLQKESIDRNINIDEVIAALSSPEKYRELPPLIINDLAKALFAKFPLLELLRENLLAAGLDAVQITGSGPTLFGITQDPEKVAYVIETMTSKYGTAVRMLFSKAGLARIRLSL